MISFNMYNKGLTKLYIIDFARHIYSICSFERKGTPFMGCST